MKFGISLFILFSLAFQGMGLRAENFYKARENALKPGRFQLGPFQVFPQLTLENIGYTDNIYAYESDSQPGWMADLGLQVKAVAVVGSRLVLTVEDHPYYSYFSAESEERAFNNTLKAKVNTRLAGLHLVYAFQYADLRSRPTREFGARLRHTSLGHSLEADLGNHESLFLTVSAGQNEMKFSDEGPLAQYEPGARLNRVEQNLGLRVNLPVFTATLIALQGELRQYRFSNLTDRDGESITTSVEIRFPEIGKITGSAALGYKRFYPNFPGYNEFDTLYGKGRVSYRLLRRMRLSVDYTVDNRFSFLNPEQYYNERSILGGMDYYFSRNLRVGGSYRTGTLSYRLLADGSEQFLDHMRNYEIRIAFRLAGNTGIGLSFNLEDWDSERIGLDRSRFFIGGFVTHDF